MIKNSFKKQLMKNIDRTLAEIKKAYHEINNWLFEGKLKEPVLLVQSSARAGMRAGGWFAGGKVWQNKETGETFPEITVAAEGLNSSVHWVLSVLVHEMVHYWCKQNGIKDTSKSGYHNKKFKDAAEKFLLKCVDKPCPKRGFQCSEATEKLKNFFDMLDLDEDAFDIGMQAFAPRNKKKYEMYVYECDKCKKTFKAKAKLKTAECDHCGGEYKLKHKEEAED